MNRRTPRLLLAVALSATGCGRETPVHTYDKAPLEALQKYDPQYKLDNNGRVVELVLNQKQLDDDAFDQLGKLTALRRLSLYGSSVSDAGLEKLTAVGQLRSLGLGRTAITDKGLSHLASLPRLRWLWVTIGRGVSVEAVEKLKATLPELEVFRQ